MSNDTEFDAVVSFWSERGMNVSRVPVSYTHLTLPTKLEV